MQESRIILKYFLLFPKMTDFQKYLAQAVGEVNKVMEISLGKWSREAGSIHSSLGPLAKLFTDRNFGGKTLRGCLVKLGYDLAEGSATKEIYKAGAAVEVFQTAILAHDDIIDKSPTRRGKPTLYRELGGDHYAISQTICLGDMGFFLAVRLISESNFNDKNKNNAVSAFSNMVINTGLGEMLDVELPRLPTSKTDAAVLQIHRLKTSYYTMIYPLSIGAILAGAKRPLLKHFEVFGENLGIAFQIQDDILGVFGDEAKLGKSVTSDIEEGKNTLLITYALRNANKAQKNILTKYYGRGHIGKKELELIKKVFIDTGSLDYSKLKAAEYAHQAKRVIPKITKDIKFKTLLGDLTEYLVSREK
ncbi:MAG: Polyprenyl synthetase superfamily [Microgenomates group bacterium Gr01-1014_5]|nr:MAG: Polyprenyl synthetase superfamily [Microgenomates group bacterium Gr01-1014_5]